MLQSLAAWLDATAVSMTIKDVIWIIPVVQTVHILCIAIVLSSVAILDFRLMGLSGRRVTITGMFAHFTPWIWSALVVLLISGIILIVGEPRRSLLNDEFQLKMLLLLAAIAVTIGFQRSVRRNAQFWDSSEHGGGAKLTALVSLALWIGIAVCGRLIAYVDVNS